MYWLLPDFHFKFKPSIKQTNKKAPNQTRELHTTLSSPPNPVNLLPFTQFISHVPEEPWSDVSATQVALKTPVPIRPTTHHLPSSCLLKRLTAPAHLQQMFPHRSKQTHMQLFQHNSKVQAKELLSQRLYQSNNKTFKKRKISSMLSCFTWVLFITSSLLFILTVTDH